MRRFFSIAVLLASIVTVAHAGSDCVDVEFSGVIVQQVPGGLTEGDVDMIIDGVMQTAHMSVTIVRAKSTEDGTQETDWATTFDLGDGNTFGSLIHGVLSPTEPLVFRANAQGKITEGTGVYADSLGKIVIHGTFSVLLSPVWAEAVLEGQGRLCDMQF